MTSWATGWLQLLLLLLLPTAVRAQFNYVTNGGIITITEYTGPGGDVTIPTMINGLPVVAIGDFAFAGSITNGNNLASVTIPDSVTNIGVCAFAFSYNLTNVAMGNGIISIGGEAFYICTSLTQITIPNGVTSIGQSAFDSCYGLTSVALGNSITNIADSSFNFCASLTNITLPDSVTGIGDYAFYGCSSLTNVNIPAAVTHIGSSAFDSCPDLTAITVNTLNSSYSSVGGVLFDKAQTTLLECPGGKSGAFTIPEGVTTITDDAFYNCTNLTSVTVPASVSSIGMEAFGSCPSLTQVRQLTERNCDFTGVFAF